MSPSHPFFRWALALVCLMLVHGAVLFYWTRNNTVPLAWDQAIHTKIALDYQERLATGSITDLFRPVSFSYPPLYHFLLAPAMRLVADPAQAGIPVNFFYLCILILAVFFIGRDVAGPWEGFTAAALAACYPSIVWLLHTTLIDLSLTAWVAVMFYFWLRSDHFASGPWSALFGVSLGLSTLTKWTALAYVLFPLLSSVWFVVRDKRWKNFLIAVAAGFVVMAPWYAQNLFPVMVQLPILSGLPPASGESADMWAKIFWYPLTFKEQMGPWFYLLFLPGLAAVVWRPKFFPVVLWVAGSLLLFSLIRNKNVRYFAPALPALALLSAAWLPSWKRISYLAVIAATAAFVFVSIPKQYLGKQDWHHADIIQRVKELHGASPAPASVLMVANDAYFHSTSLNMTARLNKENAVSFHSPSRSRGFEFADFVLTTTGFLGPEFTLGNINKCAAVIRKPEPWFTETYREVGRWPLPNGEAVLYFCDPKPQKFADAGSFNISLNELELPHIKATGVELRATPLSPADTRVGRLKELVVRCKSLDYKSISFQNVMVRLVRPQINLPLYLATQEIQLCRLQALEPHATIDAGVLIDYAAKKARWLSEPSVVFDGPLVKIKGRAQGVPVALTATLTVESNTFRSHIQSVRVAGIPVPLLFVRAVFNKTVPLARGRDWAYDIAIARVGGNGAAFQLGGKP